MLQVSSESLLDRSKSIKSYLMELFDRGCTNIEGADNYHACYGGTRRSSRAPTGWRARRGTAGGRWLWLPTCRTRQSNTRS